MKQTGTPAPTATVAKRTSLREQVAHALRRAVISGDMAPGKVYSAPALAARFGVSPTPVREAMLDLATQGLVEVVPNKGFQVTRLSDTELDQIIEIRLLLEPPTVERAVAQAQLGDVAGLTVVAEGGVAAAAAGDLFGYVEADREFHRRLLTLGGNNRLVVLVDELRNRSRLAEPAGLAERGLLGVSAAEHVTMCQHLTEGDGAALATLMRVHIAHGRDRS
ncbi:GntR family transcriptional regulator [Phytoactinopolyspora limicola]|uniref:GntR family transcriptional regulator n=1 Tax=Phytoactinopolyspora limicola TaxID=2715536 RepID=UPI00140B6AB0|nr:GntR family transcriptional regulator [Phytoactinopolyspora limicola]